MFSKILKFLQKLSKEQISQEVQPEKSTAQINNQAETVPFLYKMDPQNHDPSYKEDFETHYVAAFADDFDYRYERKLDSFSDKVDSLIEKATSRDEHPDKMLARFDKALEYVHQEMLPFFESKIEYYGKGILSEYHEYEERIKQEKEYFLASDYQDFLQDYQEEMAIKKRIASISRTIVSILKKTSPVKRADLYHKFSQDEKPMVRKALNKLTDKGKIEIGRPNGKTRGPLYVSLLPK